MLLLIAILAAPGDFPKFEPQVVDPHIGNVCYAVTVADVDGDKRPDVVAVSEDAVVWYHNPDWKKHEIIRGVTAHDNVCIQAHDIDGDGEVDFALGAGWRPPDTKNPSTLQWLGRDRDGRWQVHPIAFEEPTLHRIRWGDVLGNGKKQLVVAPLQGRGATGPKWDNGPGIRVLVYSIPDDPTSKDWPVEVADEGLHTVHNLQVLPFFSDNRNDEDILLAAHEGIFIVQRLGKGKYLRSVIAPTPENEKDFKGASEIKMGRLANGTHYFATIEPWHGYQVVTYSYQGNGKRDKRTVIDEPVSWGHAVWCADLDGDGDEELIIGQRDANKEGTSGNRGPGIWVYDPSGPPTDLKFTKHVIDDGGIGTEDALAADLDGDGKPEIIGGGRSTHNVKVYWNRGAGK